MNKIIAKNKGDLSKAAIDFFSFGHLLAGYFIFLILDALFFVLFDEFVILLCFITIFFCGVFWELIENTYFFKKDIKFGYRRDSLLNSSMDIVMLTVGGVIAAACLEVNIETFLITTAVFYISTILLMIIYANSILDLFKSIKKKK